MTIPLNPFLRKLIYPFVAKLGNKNVYSAPPNHHPAMSVYDIPLKTIKGELTSLLTYKGKRILIVNVASECGYTGQYAPLEEIYKAYSDKLVVVGFPCNDFGAQEPGTADEILNFCSKHFDVTFPMMEKVVIKGDDRHPLYKWLTDPFMNGWNSEVPTWNFAKFVIDEEGKLLHYLSPSVDPFDTKIVDPAWSRSSV